MPWDSCRHLSNILEYIRSTRELDSVSLTLYLAIDTFNMRSRTQNHLPPWIRSSPGKLVQQRMGRTLQNTPLLPKQDIGRSRQFKGSGKAKYILSIPAMDKEPLNNFHNTGHSARRLRILRLYLIELCSNPFFLCFNFFKLSRPVIRF